MKLLEKHLLDILGMTAKPLIGDPSLQPSHLAVRVELTRSGLASQRLDATLLRLTTLDAEIRTSQRLRPGQQLWLVLEVGDSVRWTTRRWLVEVVGSSISPHGAVSLMRFSKSDLAPRLSHHIVRTDGRTKSYRFDKSWHSDTVGHRDESRTTK